LIVVCFLFPGGLAHFFPVFFKREEKEKPQTLAGLMSSNAKAKSDS
jgi:hypothetical protein